LFSYQPQRDAPAQLFVTSSADNGQSFSNSRQIAATATSSTAPAVGVGPKTGTLYIAWAEIDTQQQSASIYFSKSTDVDQGSSFTTPLRISSVGISLAPRIAIDADENIYLIWEAGGNSIWQRQILFARSVDSGRSFSQEMPLSTIGTFARPNIVSVGGSLFVIWKDQNQQPAVVAYAQSQDRGDHFTPSAPVPGSSTLAAPQDSGLSAAALSTTSFGLLFQDKSTNPDSIWLMRTDAKGQSFQAPSKLDGAEEVASAPVLFTLPRPDGPGATAAAWLGNLKGASGTSFGLMLSCADENGDMHDPRLAASLGSGSSDVTVVANGDGLVHSVVVQMVGQDSRLVYIPGRCPARFQASSLVNAASQQTPGVVPGSLATLYGAELGPTTGTQVAGLDSATGFLLTSAKGVTVRFDGVPAPLFYVGRNQLNIQVPVELAGKSSSQVTVEYQGVKSLAIPVPVATEAPSFFTLSDAGFGPVIAMNEDGMLNGLDAPAAKTSLIVLYLTGHGQTSPPLQTGQLAPPVEPFARPVDQLSLFINGKKAQVFFAGGAPGYAGLLQVNAQVPADAASGAVEIRASMGNFTSRQGTTLSVK